MQALESYYFPITPQDTDQIADLVKSREVFAPSFVPTNDEDIYHPITYRRQKLHHETPTILLADRNVFTRWLALLNGARASAQHRVSAAILAFAQCSNMLVEPNLALYEAAMTAGSTTGNEELSRFRIVDNLHPQYWTDVATGRLENLALSADELPTVPEAPLIDFEMPLRRWLRNYVTLLRLAELDLQGLDRVDQITELTRWMYAEFIVGGPALVFAIYYLTPNSARRGLLKNLRSTNREKALDGIKNAAWDLTLLSDWILRIEKQKSENRLTMLCSLDRNLIRLANMLAPHTIDTNSSNLFRKTLLRELLAPWGQRTSEQMSELIEGFLSSKDNPTRQIFRPHEVNLDNMIASGETLIRNWEAATS